MDFIEAIKAVYEKDAAIKRKNTSYCIYKNKKTDCLRILSFDKTGEAIYKNYSLLSNIDAFSNDWVVTDEYDYFIARDNLVQRKLPTKKTKRL